MSTATRSLGEKLNKALVAIRHSEIRDTDPDIISLPHFGVSKTEIVEGVRSVHSDSTGFPGIFTLWTDRDDLNMLVNDEKEVFQDQPALLMINTTDLEQYTKDGLEFDLVLLQMSDKYPGWRYFLFDYKDDGNLHDLLHDLVPSFGACVRMGLG